MVENAVYVISARKLMLSVALGSCVSINTRKEISLIDANV
jgi:chemotaxis receptor (MCP) glutamine deamidase CheD